MDRPSDIHALDERELAAHANFLRRVARRLVRDEPLADDVAQETWRLAFAKPPAQVRSWRGWLGAAAANVARQFARGSERRDRHEERSATHEAMPSAAEVAVRLETERRLIDAVAALDEGDRALVLLRHFDGLAPRAIARRMKLPVETVKTRLKRALERLRVRLVERGGDRERLHSGLLLIANGLVAKVGAAGGVVAGGILMSAKGKVAVAIVAAAVVVAGVRFGGAIFGRRSGTDRSPALAESAATPVKKEPGDAADPAAAGATRVADSVAPAPAPATIAEDPTAIFGRFVDSSGRPIEGVEICSDGWDCEWPPRRRHAHGWPSMKSDEGGRFFWRRPSAPDPADAASGWSEPVAQSCGFADALVVHFVAWRPGYARNGFQRNGVTGQAMDVGDLVLQREVRIAGSVEVPAGADPRVATIELTVVSPQFMQPVPPTMQPIKTPLRRTHPDAHGRFEVGGLRSGAYRVWASLPGSLKTPSEAVELADGQARDDVTIAVDMLPANGEVLKVVVERPDGSPLAGAHVWIGFHEPGRDFALEFVADETGAVAVPTYGREVRSAIASDPANRLVPARQGFEHGIENLCVLQLGESFEVTLEFASADAAPLLPVDIEVHVVREGEDGSDGGALFRAKDDGHGRVDLWLPDGTVELTARAEGFDETKVGPLRVRDAKEPIKITLAPQPSMNGRVVAGGRPVAGATVSVLQAMDQGCVVHGAPCRAMFTGVTSRRPTDAEGRFRVVWRHGGRIYLHAHAAGFAVAEVGPFEMKEGEYATAVDGIEFELTRGGSLVGTVALGGDGAIARHVVLSNGDGVPRSWPVATDGSFRVEHLAPGPWNVRVSDAPIEFLSMSVTTLPGSAPRELPSNCVIREGETTTLTLAADDTLVGVVRGRVAGLGAAATKWFAWTGPAETPTGDVVEGKPGQSQAVPFDRDGRFELRSDAAGRSCKLVLFPWLDDTSAEAWCTWSEPITLKQGLQSWRATLAPGRIEGDVGALAAGRPLAVEADATTSDGLEFHARVPVDAAGRFVIAAAPAGDVRVRIAALGITRSVTVPAGETATLPIR